MEAMGIIFSNIYDSKMGDLTWERTSGSIPFGGRYRQIDFVLSNMSNSGIRNIGIITKYNYQSLMDHLANCEDWDLHLGENVRFLPPYATGHTGAYRGKLEALQTALPVLERSDTEYVILSDTTVLCDAGCGLGFLALQLAQRYPRVTAADISEQALDIAHAQAEEKRVSNLEIVQTDLLAYAPETRFDAMVFCLFGKMPEILPIAKRCCAGRIVVIKKAFTHHRFSMSRVPLRDEVTDRAADFLRERGVRFSLETREFEMNRA